MMGCEINEMKVLLCCAIILIRITFSTCNIPVLESKSNDMVKAVNSDVFMSCQFKDAMAFSWLKDGKVIVYSSRIYNSKIGKGMEVLNIKRFKPSDKGKYTCVALNTDGKNSADIFVDVILSYKPKIHPISNVYLKNGASYRVECDADAIPATIRYSWKKNGRRISGGNVIVRDNILDIRNMQRNDEGVYACTASNSVGSSDESFNLEVATVTKWVEKPRDENVSTTVPFEWAASIVTLSKNPVFKWYKDGSHILRDSAMSQQGAKFTSRLKFPDLNLGDAGLYKVTVEKLDFAGFQSDMTLTVFAPPSIQINEGSELSIEVGDTLSLKCNVEANPVPSIKWYFKDKLLNSQPANGNKVLTFQKHDVSEEDMGEYKCFAINEKGNTTVSINIIVESPTTSAAIQVIIILIACGVIVGLIILAVFFYLRYGERCIKAGIDEGTFYTDLVEEEKELASLADLEKNPNTLKKNINMSAGRNASVISFNNAERGNLLQTMKSFTGKKSPDKDFSRQSSIFDTIKSNPKTRQGSIFQTLKTTLTRGSLSGGENHEVRLGSFALCAGKSLDIDKLSFDEIIAEGEYGGVSKGQIIEDDDVTYKQVCIKMLKDDLMKSPQKRNMLAEIRLMRRVSNHSNIVEFVGWCVTSSNMYIVEEYMPFGNLLTFLRVQRDLHKALNNDNGVDTGEICVDQYMLLSYARQIASAMMHLGKFQIVHRDLACRNVYISYENTVKISDYAIVRDIYTPNVYRKTTGGQLPVRWMALEAIFNGEYSLKSDVWSFGILLWELCSLGRIPYPNIMRTQQLLEELAAGYHMENPGNISTDLYLLMDSCWNKNPDSRPSFNSLYATFNEYMNDVTDAEENIVHIDLSNIFNCGKNSASSDDYLLTPSEDTRRPQPFETVVEEDDDAIERNETDPLTLNC